MKKLKKINLKKEKKDNKKKTNTNVKNTILSILLIGGIVIISIALVFALYSVSSFGKYLICLPVLFD